MSISKLLAVVPVSDHDRAVAWYELFFGRPADATPMPGLADWHVSDTGWAQIYQDPERAGRTAVNFAVDDMHAHTAELAGRGIVVRDAGGTSQGGRLAQVNDPDGNAITLIESPST